MAVQQLPLDLGNVTIPQGGFITCELAAPTNSTLLIFTKLLEQTDLLIYFESNKSVVFRTERIGSTGGYPAGFNTNNNPGPYTVYILNRLPNPVTVNLSFDAR